MERLNSFLKIFIAIWIICWMSSAIYVQVERCNRYRNMVYIVDCAISQRIESDYNRTGIFDRDRWSECFKDLNYYKYFHKK